MPNFIEKSLYFIMNITITSFSFVVLLTLAKRIIVLIDIAILRVSLIPLNRK